MDIIAHFTNYYYKKIKGYLNKPTLLCFYWERNENFKTLQLADFCDKN